MQLGGVGVCPSSGMWKSQSRKGGAGAMTGVFGKGLGGGCVAAKEMSGITNARIVFRMTKHGRNYEFLLEAELDPPRGATLAFQRGLPGRPPIN
jgi:hypothetical protein